MYIYKYRCVCVGEYAYLRRKIDAYESWESNVLESLSYTLKTSANRWTVTRKKCWQNCCLLSLDACGIMVIVLEPELGDPSSNPVLGCFHFGKAYTHFSPFLSAAWPL